MKKVLILEDDIGQRAALHILLGHHNHWVKSCISMEDAKRAILTGTSPDVCLVDYYLPDGDGLAFIKWLREGEGRQKGGEHIPCLLVTAADHLGVARFRTELDRFRVHVIFKPYEPANLVEMIEWPPAPPGSHRSLPPEGRQA